MKYNTGGNDPWIYAYGSPNYGIRYFKGNHIILINKDKTPFDSNADLVINDSLGNVFKNI